MKESKSAEEIVEAEVVSNEIIEAASIPDPNPPSPNPDVLVNPSLPPEVLTGHRTGEKRPYTLFDFALAAFGVFIILGFGGFAAAIEYFGAKWIPGYQWTFGFTAGAVSTIGGLLGGVFFMNIVSKSLYNSDENRWKRNKDYPGSLQVILMMIVVTWFEPVALLFAFALAAVGGWAGGSMTGFSDQLTVSLLIGLAIPIAASTITNVFIYAYVEQQSDYEF